MNNTWNEFEKLAVEQGLISIAEDDDDKDVSKTRRNYDSLSDDAIRLLYGLKPENIYKTQDMIEAAHPETAVVAPAYDAMNGVVENVNQRQNIMAYIALKTPNGQLVQERYIAAKHDLINSVVKAAFVLDNNNDESLMSFADNCAVKIDQQAKQLHKEAAGAALALGLGAGAALLGAAYYAMYGATSAQSVYANASQVLEALDSLDDKPYANAIRKDVSSLITATSEIKVLNDKLSNIKSIKDAMDVATKSGNQSQIDFINNKRSNYIKLLTQVYNAIPRWVAAIKNTMLAETEEISDWAYKIKSITDPFIWKDEEVLIDKLWGYSKVLGTETLQGLLGKGIVAKEGTSGLRKAIAVDISNMQKAISLSKTEAESYEQSQQELAIEQADQIEQLPETKIKPTDKETEIENPEDFGKKASLEMLLIQNIFE